MVFTLEDIKNTGKFLTVDFNKNTITTASGTYKLTESIVDSIFYALKALAHREIYSAKSTFDDFVFIVFIADYDMDRNAIIVDMWDRHNDDGFMVFTLEDVKNAVYVWKRR